MIKKIVPMIMLTCSFAVNADISIGTAYGDLKIDSSGDGLWKTQTYALNSQVVGKSEYLEVDGQLLGMTSKGNYVVLRGAIGGSACAYALSIVVVNDSGVTFSPMLSACGGVENVEFNNGITTVTAYERDEQTQVVYKVNGRKVTKNGKDIMVKHSFTTEY
ncbi:TPA: hypothetical protein NJ265_004197 [Vibrio parahaemolyticus]|uniref:hypothetical protein n=1 Tax=Vibrio harveyi group TaxID=717610 RepID=UPI0011100559|nr:MULTISPECIES: hypothetical protein [Vibrio harveyi group]MBE4440614.1 hypothetical protein [Vibrio parahaemolyticus]MCR9881052.1 hypothetical protein [Vibrio parahaemolyticus]MCR9895458.1 hypothetical protein [Vibrio parahaemolyticus]MDF5057503.1 hypothetical protein [Vibrio parahaemolyticus]TMX33314.1 hypothetical protein DA098_25910 [Vibrio parahaemolyticus]